MIIDKTRNGTVNISVKMTNIRLRNEKNIFPPMEMAFYLFLMS